MLDSWVSATGDSGHWVIRARSLDGSKVDSTLLMHRDVPTEIQQVSWTDPFGPATASLTFPKVHLLERFPSSDTWWAAIGTEFDLMFVLTDPDIVAAMTGRRGVTQTEEGPAVVWEGYVESRSWNHGPGGSSLTLELLGAMRVMDARVAQKLTFNRPVPYEKVIEQHFAYADDLHPTGLATLQVEWPEWWGYQYQPDNDLPEYLRPTLVEEGERWTGMTTREFGRWDPVLSSTIQGMLSVMFTERGQFTLDLYPGRVPVLRHRERQPYDTDTTLHMDAAWPGVALQLSEDGSMSVNAIYGESRSSMSGTSYTGRQHSLSGAVMPYSTFSNLASVSDDGRDPTAIRRELYINFNDGLSAAESIEKARQHIQRNSSPGMTGTIKLDGTSVLTRAEAGHLVPFPSQAVRAGDHIRVHGIGGGDGVLFHISAAETDAAGNLQLTVDSKYRDFMTVREVIERGRDALRPWHMMTVGRYNVNIRDAMLPWSYSEGSGVIPLSAHQMGFWEGAPADLSFPWTEWTTQRPPGAKAWEAAYIKVPKIERGFDGRSDPTEQWNKPEDLADLHGTEVLLAQAGDIALLQIAAFDADGNVKKVPFHVSIWGTGASARSTPLLHAPLVTKYIDWDGTAHEVKEVDYPASSPTVGRYYPFYENAWEQIYSDGREGKYIDETIPKSDELLVGYGNHWERAGYWPGTGRSDPLDLYLPGGDLPESLPTGLLVDESGWSFDFSRFEPFSLNDPGKNSLLEHANATVLVFCESDTDTYFMGRLYRREYGGS